MRSTFFTLLLSFTCISASQYSQDILPCEAYSCMNISHDTQIGVGYRQDHLKWVITNEYFNIDPLSKLNWKNIKIVQFLFAEKITYCDHLCLKLKGDYGRIYHGENTDTDYTRFGSGSEFPFLRSRADANKGEVYDASIGIGYEMSCNNVSILPLIGCSISGQHLHMTNGYVELNEINDSIGSFSGLDSSYKTRWIGPWAGVEFWMIAPCDIDVYGGFEYHSADYHARGDWNLRQDIIGDFHHTAWGHGLFYTFGLGKYFCNCLEFRLDGIYQIWRTKSGNDRSVVIQEQYASEGSYSSYSINTIDTRLKYVKWISWSINASMAISY
jgi:hypothetical protein